MIAAPSGRPAWPVDDDQLAGLDARDDLDGSPSVRPIRTGRRCALPPLATKTAVSRLRARCADAGTSTTSRCCSASMSTCTGAPTGMFARAGEAEPHRDGRGAGIDRRRPRAHGRARPRPHRFDPPTRRAGAPIGTRGASASGTDATTSSRSRIDRRAAPDRWPRLRRGRQGCESASRRRRRTSRAPSRGRRPCRAAASAARACATAASASATRAIGLLDFLARGDAALEQFARRASEPPSRCRARPARARLRPAVSGLRPPTPGISNRTSTSPRLHAIAAGVGNLGDARRLGRDDDQLGARRRRDDAGGVHDAANRTVVPPARS